MIPASGVALYLFPGLTFFGAAGIDGLFLYFVVIYLSSRTKLYAVASSRLAANQSKLNQTVDEGIYGLRPGGVVAQTEPPPASRPPAATFPIAGPAPAAPVVAQTTVPDAAIPPPPTVQTK